MRPVLEHGCGKQTPSNTICFYCIWRANFLKAQGRAWVVLGATQLPAPTMGWLRLVGSLQLYVSFAKEPDKRDDSLQKRHMILRSLLLVATPCLLQLDPPVELWWSGGQAQFASHYCGETHARNHLRKHLLRIITGNAC